jgi:hypothetical protein
LAVLYLRRNRHQPVATERASGRSRHLLAKGPHEEDGHHEANDCGGNPEYIDHKGVGGADIATVDRAPDLRVADRARRLAIMPRATRTAPTHADPTPCWGRTASCPTLATCRRNTAKRAIAKPNAISAMPVRIQASMVRSLARCRRSVHARSGDRPVQHGELVSEQSDLGEQRPSRAKQVDHCGGEHGHDGEHSART